MKGDFSRLTFDASRHYVAVRAQQGRVSVDADVNEVQDIVDHRQTSAVADIVGPVGTPVGDPFGVTISGGVPAVTSGHLYVDGVLVEADADHPVTNQPHLPDSASLVRRADGTWVALAAAPAGRYLAYVDVWRHHLTALDDPRIREVALGGPDTATREQLVWQVRLLQVGAVGDAAVCAGAFGAWDAVTTAPTGTLAVRAEPDPSSGSPCLVPADAGFRRLDNQLYRVEIHDGGTTGTATWKASRDNGAVERRLVGVVGDDLHVSRPGRDAADGFPSGCWVEITDDTRVLQGRPGTLVRVVSADGDAIRIDPLTATGSLAPADFPLTPRVRRWDTDGPRPVQVGPGDGYLEIEDGVQVRFSAGTTWRTGDYWMIPARVATGDVEWPQSGGAPAAVGPHGVRHHHARLAILTRTAAGVWSVDEVCAPAFPPITALRTLDHVAGDGQEALPDPTAPGAVLPLARPLVAGVSMGSLPVAGASVRFEVTAGSGTLDGGLPGAATTATTGPDGLASVAWAVDSTTASQQVTAHLLASGGTPIHLPVVFGAELSTAATTAFDPAACPPLSGAVTVQDAIERLCELGRGGCATLVLSPGPGWREALAQLQAGSDAVICFRPGEYETDEPVVLDGLGSLVIHGAGPATVVRGVGIERVLVITGATAVRISDLDIRATAVGATAHGHEHVNGALTVLETPDVTIERVRAQSGAGTRRQAACITVRGTAARPVRARIRDCDLTPGHQQVGLLVVHVDDAQLTGNRVNVARKGRRLSLSDLLRDQGVRTRLVNRLVTDVAPTPVPPRGSNTVLDVGGFTVAFNSPVPAEEWRVLLRENPPTAAERADETTIAGYVNRVVDGVVEQPNRLRTLAGTVENLRLSLGAAAFGGVDRRVLRRLVVADDVTVVAPTIGEGMVRLPVGNESLTFRSELDSRTWTAVLAAAGTPNRPAEPAALVRGVAERLLVDADLRRSVPAADRWFAALASDNPAAAAQGIVVGGEVARAVEVRDNVLDGVEVGIHVALSHRAPVSTSPDIAERVHIVDNVITLRLPVDRRRGQYGILLGNTHHGLVAGNDLRVADRAETARDYDEGIRVWGHLGAFLGVRENVVANASVGIRVEPVNQEDRARQWFVVDNSTPNAGQSVQAPQTVRRRDNLS